MRMPMGESPHTQNTILHAEHREPGTANLRSSHASSNEPNAIHRKCDACEEDDDEPSESVMRKEAFAAAAPTPPPDETPPSIRNVINSGGEPLDLPTRSFFEPRFGYDFSNVRIHRDTSAGQSARTINAKAYTLGNNIVFASGEYQPRSERGQYLIAHELAHVSQGHSGTISRKGDALDDVFEGTPEGGETGEPGSAGQSGSSAQTGGCPKTPTHLGDDKPKPPCPKATHQGTNEIARFHFCLDSDQLTSPDEIKTVDALVSGRHQKTRFMIHGYASPEGHVEYNFNLAGHRANKIADAFKVPVGKQAESRMTMDNVENSKEIVDAELQSRIETGSQGPTTEFGQKAEENRVVVVYALSPGVEEELEPGCEDAPKGIGKINPEVPCDLSTKDLTGMDGSNQLMHIHFCLDSDVFAAEHPFVIRNFARQQASSANFIVHGFSSTEGDAEYNRRLSCHRAQRVARELANAGVRASQITEVSGMGETDKFGDADFNRVAIILAEGGKVSDINDRKGAEAKTVKEREAVRDEAVKRIAAGQYKLAADAYISFWTCGRTRTITEAVERLTIEVKKEPKDEVLQADINGKEEGIGVNRVILSNAAIHADNSIECVMGRLIDMSFHHAILGYSDLPTADRHRAGLHLIHLAGLGGCEGESANRTGQIGKESAGIIDKPLETDPRRRTPPPTCAEAPEPTRLHTPTSGAEKRERPTFDLVGQPTYTAATGKIENDAEQKKEGAKLGMITTVPVNDMLVASAEVQLNGDPSTFADYEVGFVQAVLADETQADYTSGNHVIQQLPTPIRMAHLAGNTPVPAPWTTLNAMEVPKADGKVNITTKGIGLNTKVTFGLRLLGNHLPNSGMAEFEHGSTIAIWLIARRRGAPLDRFSIHFIDGATYSLTQRGQSENRRVKGEIKRTADPGTEEKELFMITGGFHSVTSLDPATIDLIQLKGATAADISLQNQVKKVTDADPAPADGMDDAQLKAAIADILDNLTVFQNSEDAKKGTSGTKMPRLGYDFIPLEITIPFMRATGRIETPNTDSQGRAHRVVEVKGPGLGFDAAQALAVALEFRIHDRSFEGKGRDIVVDPNKITPKKDSKRTEPEVIETSMTIDPLPRRKDAPASEEPDLVKRPGVLKDMARAWDCTKFTDGKPEEFGPKAIEFGATYVMDREKKLTVDPPDRLKSGVISADEEVSEIRIPCPQVPDKVRLGAFHTHPDTPNPSEADIKATKDCDMQQHYIVNENKVFRFNEKGDLIDLNITLPTSEKCREVDLEELRAQVKKL